MNVTVELKQIKTVIVYYSEYHGNIMSSGNINSHAVIPKTQKANINT